MVLHRNALKNTAWFCSVQCELYHTVEMVLVDLQTSKTEFTLALTQTMESLWGFRNSGLHWLAQRQISPSAGANVGPLCHQLRWRGRWWMRSPQTGRWGLTWAWAWGAPSLPGRACLTVRFTFPGVQIRKGAESGSTTPRRREPPIQVVTVQVVLMVFCLFAFQIKSCKHVSSKSLYFHLLDLIKFRFNLLDLKSTTTFPTWHCHVNNGSRASYWLHRNSLAPMMWVGRCHRFLTQIYKGCSYQQLFKHMTRAVEAYRRVYIQIDHGIQESDAEVPSSPVHSMRPG